MLYNDYQWLRYINVLQCINMYKIIIILMDSYRVVAAYTIWTNNKNLGNIVRLWGFAAAASLSTSGSRKVSHIDIV